jgi:hypothetical protein
MVSTDALHRRFSSWKRGGLLKTRTVDLHLAVGDDGPDHALLLEVANASSRQGAVDLHSVDEGGDRDEAVRLDILVELVRGGLVEQDGVLRLILDLALGPGEGEWVSISSWRPGMYLELIERTTAEMVSHETRDLKAGAGSPSSSASFLMRAPRESQYPLRGNMWTTGGVSLTILSCFCSCTQN